MKILFVDNDCPEALDDDALGRGPLGGTEASLFRIARSLAHHRGLEVAVAQHNRDKEAHESETGVRYLHYSHEEGLSEQFTPDAIVVLRKYKILPRLRKRYPAAKLFLWMHCYPGKRWRNAVDILRRTQTRVVAVSDHLRDEMINLLRPQLQPWKCEHLVQRIFNPVHVTPDSLGKGSYDPDKLVFFSSPHKGLEDVLANFAHVRRAFPSMRLVTADPGYWKGPRATGTEGVVSLGALKPDEVHREVADALCVFYPQTWFAETFGLVFAEANALGTPVLAHNLGAAGQVLPLGGPDQLCDCSDPASIVERIRSWREGSRPRVSLNPAFTIEQVTWDWINLLAAGESSLIPKARPLGELQPIRPLLAGQAA
ncbi:MAG: glycosyltransferase family 4 protein [Verrucomicrobiota bacterium JB023]|nr:glycosyltransferase family 4 protein [Verrucomicrobiota bacterium JB023]